MTGNRQCDIFDNFGNYHFPMDIKSTGPNIAYSSPEGYLYSLGVWPGTGIIGETYDSNRNLQYNA